MTSTTRHVRAGATVAGTAARAVLAAVLAAITTFWPQPDRTAPFGLVVLGAFLLVQAVLAAVALPRTALDRVGRLLLGARAVVSLVAGVVALVGVGAGAALLLPLEAVVFLVLGVLEFAGGFRRPTDGDAVVVGGLQALVGLLLIVLSADALFAIGLLSAWGAVVAVYLGISAANLRRGTAR